MSKPKPKPGGGTPPPITTGNFVSWSGGRGRVDMIVTSGKVPGVDDDVEGSKDSPAARVVVWEKDGDGYKPSRKKIAKATHVLKRIAPLTGGKSAPAGSATALVELLAQHEQRVSYDRLGEHALVSGQAVKSVYERGVAAWPGEKSTMLTREEWAEQRVGAFLSVAAGDHVEGYTRDLGLLAKTHPLHPDNPGEAEAYEVDLSELEGLLTD